MFLSQPDRDGKPQHTCTARSHEIVRSSQTLFETLTNPLGHQDAGDGSYLEIGQCRNCGTTLARKPDPDKAALLEAAFGGGR